MRARTTKWAASAALLTTATAAVVMGLGTSGSAAATPSLQAFGIAGSGTLMLNGQNLRHNLADHSTVEDTTLTTPPGTGPAKGVTAAAYTNNDLNGTTNTTLFNVNTTTDQVVIQSPANNGFLVATGSLGVDAGPDAGFDIFSDLSNGKTVSATAFAVLTPAGGFQTFYTVDLLTGAASKVGEFPLDVSDVAVALDTM
jgi:hypothetical protein